VIYKLYPFPFNHFTNNQAYFLYREVTFPRQMRVSWSNGCAISNRLTNG